MGAAEYLNDLGFKTEFEVVNENYDDTPPEINTFEVSEDKFDVTNGDATFNLSASFSDDLSGFINNSDVHQSCMNFNWISPSGDNYIYAIMYEGMNQDREYVGVIENLETNYLGNSNITFENVQVTIPQYSEPGIWTLDSISALDLAGNRQYLRTDSEGNYENFSEYLKFRIQNRI